jgi:hypothetical protein
MNLEIYGLWTYHDRHTRYKVEWVRCKTNVHASSMRLPGINGLL